LKRLLPVIRGAANEHALHIPCLSASNLMYAGNGAEYGRERLERKVREGRELSARKLIDFLYADVLEWTEGRGATDDVTFVVIKAL